MAFSYALLSRGQDTVIATNRGDARSQYEVGNFHYASAMRLELVEGAPADDAMVTASWADALSFLEKAAEQGVADAQLLCAKIYSTGDRSVLQNWTTAVKWLRKAAEAGTREDTHWYMGLCYYYGRGVDRDVAQAKVWFRRAASQGDSAAAHAVESGDPGHPAVREVLARFTNAGSAPPRHEAAHEFAGMVNAFWGPLLRGCSRQLHEGDSAVPHPSLRDSVWVDFMLVSGLSDEELELAKRVYAYSLRTCTFCGSNSAPLATCSRCKKARYCIGTDCQYRHWTKTPAAESHKILCHRM